VAIEIDNETIDHLVTNLGDRRRPMAGASVYRRTAAWCAEEMNHKGHKEHKGNQWTELFVLFVSFVVLTPEKK